ncbi:MAG: subfamily IIIC HAD-superfamily phosphatase [Planctomycetota bacterium]|nr:MAG: subfamily IIIC HAD-superfamily phosphatase [Planctomycetota bacterium]
MTLVEALRIVNRRASDSARRGLSLACGFTPLHLKTFLAAHLAERTSSGRIDVEVGLFGDLPGTLELSLRNPTHEVVVPLEWSDLDARLGLRGAHDWRAGRLTDILSSVRMRLGQLTALLTELSRLTTVALSLPTLPLPPMFKSPRGAADPASLELHRQLAEFAAGLAQSSAVRIVDPQHLETLSPLGTRYDVASDLRTGFPYRLPHACALAGELAGLLRPAAPLKGLITDLDNTLWSGIVGEEGVDGISWDLDHKTQIHAVYQSLLGSLSELGVLVGVASKNDLVVVQQSLKRTDLVVPPAGLFPIEANWGAKSESIRRILQTWNIGAESVVFIDDSPNELAEVAAGVPGIRCLQFPTGNDAAILQLVGELRDLFGKTTVSLEDQLRVSSLRDGGAVLPTTADPDEFLRQADADIKLEWNTPDARCLELINKTNQFNLNGRRLDEAEWRQRMSEPEGFLLAVNYTDRYAPLGKISVLAGRWRDGLPWIDVWVLSCRAFSRRIEHHVLKACFERFGVDQLVFDFQPTERNGPVRNLLIELTGSEPHSPTTLTRLAFDSRCPSLFAKVLSDDPQTGNRIAA